MKINQKYPKDNIKEKTQLLLNRIETSKFSILENFQNHTGYKYTLGIANPSFHQKYAVANANEVSKNPYFGLILDVDGQCINSHFFGIDGPMFFWDIENPKILLVFLLSFERHAYVGHYLLSFES